MLREELLSEEYWDFIVDAEDEANFYEIISVKREDAEPLSLERYSYDSIPKCFTLLDTEAMSQAGILQVQSFPTLELQGTGVLIGLIDTGIDYTSPLFRNLDGSTRILRIWDQTIQDGPAPYNLGYGTEYTEEQINEALRRENPYESVPSRDENSHGSFLASLAAGGGDVENQFLGAAPDAALAVVKLKEAKQYLKDFYLIGTSAPCYQETDVMLAVQYLNRLAEEKNLPLVLCLALGTNQGSHSASSPLAGLLDIVANRQNRAVVIGAGNEANQRHHFQGRTASEERIREVEIRVDSEVNGFVLEVWTDPFQLFQVAVESPSGERTYFFPIRGGNTGAYEFVLERSVLTVDYKVFAERLDGELILIRLENPTAGIWKVLLEPVGKTIDGSFHMWLPVNEFLTGEVFFLESDPDATFTEPGSVISGITVGFFDGKDNSVAIPSGRGYTRSMRIKPDFVAPGVEVLGYAGRGRFAQRTGSSIAAGITAGAAALIMEWVVYRLEEETIVSTQVRDLLILGTEQRPQETYPNREWGYGKLNVYNTFETLRRI